MLAPFTPLCFLASIVVFAGFLVMPVPARADYYICSHVGSNGNGSATAPWKTFWDINWPEVATSLASSNVTIHVCSRGAWPAGATIQATSAHVLTLEGASQYNMNVSGTVWNSETSGARAVISNSAFYLKAGTSNLVICGFEMAGSNIGNSDTGYETNINFITVSNCFFHDVTFGGPAIGFSYMTTNCHDFHIVSNVISNSHNEAIYVCRFNYMLSTVSNVIIEYNTVLNCGSAGDGSIDLKPGCVGAVVRYNIHTNTPSYTNQMANGIICFADGCQIYGNTLAGMRQDVDGTEWGWGIYVSSDGDGVGNGRPINSCLIYNNLIYSNDRNALQVAAGTATTNANIFGLKIFNNTFSANGIAGVQMTAANGRTISVAMTNNLFLADTNNVASGATYEVVLGGDVTLTSDNNVFYHPFGPPFKIGDYEETWASWQALGYDAHGKTNGPALGTDWAPTATDTVARANGVDLSSVFTNDHNGNTRIDPWDVGAFMSTSPATAPTPPTDLHFTAYGP